MASGTDKNLDDILDSALDEFQQQAPAEQDSGQDLDEGSPGAGEDAYARELSNLFANMNNNPDLLRSMQETASRLGGAPGGQPDLAQMLSALNDPLGQGGAGGPDFQANVSQAMQLMQQTAAAVETMSPEERQRMSESVMEHLAQQFSQLGENPEFASIMENMMQQMLSKDVLYKPMCDIRDKYPSWMEANRATLSEDDLQRYARQKESLDHICLAYEETPDDFQKIVTLMQEMQELGQPPPEILQEVAPGIEFGPDGVPRFPGMAPDPMNPASQCSIM
mmetsp:Transcript_4750/g.8148  ORF Transcript_4750/g.8148 Transcript_4750/m.8148 type:complete len:279 (+) Transcript_4750:19-855(+)